MLDEYDNELPPEILNTLSPLCCGDDDHYDGLCVLKHDHSGDRKTARQLLYKENTHMRTEIGAALGKLRHAYLQGARKQIGDQRAFAEGLLAPVIRRLEGVLNRT